MMTGMMQPPLYPYAVAAQHPYAIEVAPNTYVIRRSGYPSVTCVNCGHSSGYLPPVQNAPAFDRPYKSADRALIEELHRRSDGRRTIINTRKIVREKPIIHTTTRIADDPPRVIERRHVVVDPAPPPPQHRARTFSDAGDDSKPAAANEKRVINADAEITILGPDCMSIRLFRKHGGAEAKARPGE
jgi:hypothetical protein